MSPSRLLHRHSVSRSTRPCIVCHYVLIPAPQPVHAENSLSLPELIDARRLDASAACTLPRLGPPTGTRGVASPLPRHGGQTLVMLPTAKGRRRGPHLPPRGPCSRKGDRRPNERPNGRGRIFRIAKRTPARSRRRYRNRRGTGETSRLLPVATRRAIVRSSLRASTCIL